MAIRRRRKIAITHPRAVVVCQSLVVNDQRGEEAEEEGAQQFATHHLQQIFTTLSMKKKNDIFVKKTQPIYQSPEAGAGFPKVVDTPHWTRPEKITRSDF